MNNDDWDKEREGWSKIWPEIQFLVSLALLVTLFLAVQYLVAREPPSPMSDTWEIEAVDDAGNRVRIDLQWQYAEFGIQDPSDSNEGNSITFRAKVTGNVATLTPHALYHYLPRIRIWLLYSSPSRACRESLVASDSLLILRSKDRKHCGLGIKLNLTTVPDFVVLTPGTPNELRAEFSGRIDGPDTPPLSGADLNDLMHPKWSLLQVWGMYEPRTVDTYFLGRHMGTITTAADPWHPVQQGQTCTQLPPIEGAVVTPGSSGCPPQREWASLQW